MFLMTEALIVYNNFLIIVHVAENEGRASAGTRIIIFSQYRDSVNEITEILSRHRPLVKVMSFVGHSTTGKNSKGFSQKDQLKVC
jgi:ERCC4-related helicase